MELNRKIYNQNYSAESLCLDKAKESYDKKMIAFRFDIIKKYGANKEVLDLCCGSGSYLMPMLNEFKNAVGIDFSSNFLGEFMRALGNNLPAKLKLVEADARYIPIKDNSFDFVFSFCSLYYVPQVERAIDEIARVLRPGGYAAIELGNLHSLNTLVCNVSHKYSLLAKPYHIPYRSMEIFLKNAGLRVIERHSFQISPMYGAPRKILFLYPLLGSFWKKILGIEVGGKMLDEWLSSSWPLRYLAFRHLFIVKNDK